MARIKVLAFALVVLGLWLAQLSWVAPAASNGVIETAGRHASSASAAVALRLSDRRSDLQRAAMRVVGSNAIATPLRSGTREAPSPEKFTPVRAAVSDALPGDLRRVALVGLATEAGNIYARGEAEPSTGTEGFDLSKATQSGGDGSTSDAFGVPHVFYSVPVAQADRVLGTVVVGAPAWPEGLAEKMAAELNVAGLAIFSRGKKVDSGGPQKVLAERTTLKAGDIQVVDRGSTGALAFLSLPMFTGGDAAGGKAPLSVGSRQALSGTPFEVVTVVSVAPAMQGLAAAQKASLFAFLALVVLSGVVIFGVGLGASREGGLIVSTPPPFVAKQPAAAAAEAKALASMEQMPPPPEANPEDFAFNSSAPLPPQDDGELEELSADALEAEAEGAEPETDSEAQAAPSDGFPFAPPPTGPPLDAPYDNQTGTDNEATMAYPSHLATSDPFAMASQAPAMPGEYGDPYGDDDNPEATRVAQIPQELLQASFRGDSVDVDRRSAVLPSMPQVAVDPEESHFQDTYQSFLQTREQCGEAADGLTYDKFAQKLRRNREQLIAKYSCRTVRFQVYVKEGKAALKATPVKD